MHKKIIICIVAFLIIITAIAVVVIHQRIDNFDTYMENLEIVDVNLSNLEDGIYYGQVDTGVIVVEVNVRVDDYKITDIDLIKHRSGQGQPADAIIDDIIREQTLMVDAISGATLSSDVIKKAVEIALTP